MTVVRVPLTVGGTGCRPRGAAGPELTPMSAMSESGVIDEVHEDTVAPACWCTDPGGRWLQQLHDVEWLLTEALVQARASALRCEQALARLATIREHAARQDAHSAGAVLNPAGLRPVRDQADDVG